MESNKEKQLTSVRIPNKLFDEFRVLSIRTKFTLQKLVERSAYLYVTDEEFRKQIHNQLDTDYQGEEMK